MPSSASFETRPGQNAVNNRVNSLDADGFTVTNNNAVNNNGDTYHYIAWANVAGQVAHGTFTGNTSDNRNITGVGFQPAFVFLRASPSTNQEPVFKMASTGAATDTTQSTDNLANFANGIQALQADGFQVGTSIKVNNNGTATYWTAFGAVPAAVATTTTLTASPLLVTDTGAGASVTVTMTVSSASAVSLITPPTNLTVINGANGATATKVSGPSPATGSLGAGGGSVAFTYTYNVTADATPPTLPDSVRFSGPGHGHRGQLRHGHLEQRHRHAAAQPSPSTFRRARA